MEEAEEEEEVAIEGEPDLKLLSIEMISMKEETGSHEETEEKKDHKLQEVAKGIEEHH